MPLASIDIGKRVRLQTIYAKRELKARLAVMGLVPGTFFTVVGASKNGPYVISVRNSRIMLDATMGQSIIAT